MGLNKTIKAIRELLVGTGAKVTLEWPDGRKATITQHVYGVRVPEKLKMPPADDTKLYTWDVLEGETLSGVGRATIQGDENAPWMKKDDSTS